MIRTYLFILISSLLFFSCSSQDELVNTDEKSAVDSFDYTLKDLNTADFDTLHSQVGTDENKYLILGNIPVIPPAENLPDNLAKLSGRWEGYNLDGMVAKDFKITLILSEISDQSVKVIDCFSSNIQFPDGITERMGKVISPEEGIIQLKEVGQYGMITYTFQYQPETDELSVRETLNENFSEYIFKREQNYFVYKDYDAYLASLNISIQKYDNPDNQKMGAGYMLYLPKDYDRNPDKDYPLIYFLHGYGDRGENIHLLAKASPFMRIRQGHDLPFIIAAPILRFSNDYPMFPNEYLEGVYGELISKYRIDRDRVYISGLSMGGIASYHFTMSHTDKVAALAVLSALNPEYLEFAKNAGFQPFSSNPVELKDIPIYIVHGKQDMLFPVSAAEKTVADLRKSNDSVEFHILEDGDHDTWTDTYSDPHFYDWLLQHSKN
ncbi:MAG: prolyl oligopeptidase family serine peptidase [Spirochaetaceae bacterium]|nr:prolyl oligopeptidase family serine peptidase [Spirochaetaceae bacterium]